MKTIKVITKHTMLIWLLSVFIVCCAATTEAENVSTNVHDQKEIARQHPEAVSLIKEANQLSNSGKPKEALKVCNKAIGICPYLSFAYTTLSSVHGMLG